MKRIVGFVLLLLVAQLAQAVSVVRGRTPSGTDVVFYIPFGWQAGDGAVIFNRGFSSELPTAPTVPEVLVSTADSFKFAVLSSAYSVRGWSLFQTQADNREMLKFFQDSFGAVGPLYTIGGSMGGVVSLQLAEMAERGEIPPLKGVLAACAPLAGSRIWDQALDFRVTYDAICEGVSGGELPRDSEFPYLLPRSAVNGSDDPLRTAEVAAAAARCIGLNVPDNLQSSSQKQRRARLLAANKAQEPFLQDLLYYATFALSDLHFDSKKLAGVPAFENRGVDYGDADLNGRVRRVSSNTLSRMRLSTNYTPYGVFNNDTKLMLLQTSGDGIVVPEHLSLAPVVQRSSQRRSFLVRESTPTHCGFSTPELAAAFGELVRWSTIVTFPTAQRMNQACQTIAGNTATAGACRFEEANTASIDTRIPPRLQGQFNADARINGLWFNPARPGEGFVLEVMPDGRALLIWFTYPSRTRGLGEQYWVVADGRVSGNVLIFSQSFTTRGFFNNLDPSRSEILPFGPIRIAFDRCGHAVGDFSGPEGYGAGTLDLIQLNSVNGNSCSGSTATVPGAKYSGTWSSTLRSGFNFSIQGDGRAQVTWYNYDVEGNQIWLIGEGRFENGQLVVPKLLQTGGTFFGSSFNSSQITQRDFGSLRVDFRSCTAARLTFDLRESILRGGTIDIERLTIPSGVSCVE